MDPQQARIRTRHLRQTQESLKYKKASRIIGLTLGATVISIYFYSMYMVKQETVMKEIDDSVK